MRYRLTKSAERDLFDIWDYTVTTWGAQQAERYLRTLEERFEALAKNPDIGQARNEILPGYRSYHEARHVIFYRFETEMLVIARVLNERMDMVERLKENSGDE